MNRPNVNQIAAVGTGERHSSEASNLQNRTMAHARSRHALYGCTGCLQGSSGQLLICAAAPVCTPVAARAEGRRGAAVWRTGLPDATHDYSVLQFPAPTATPRWSLNSSPDSLIQKLLAGLHVPGGKERNTLLAARIEASHIGAAARMVHVHLRQAEMSRKRARAKQGVRLRSFRLHAGAGAPGVWDQMRMQHGRSCACSLRTTCSAAAPAR